MEYDQSRSRSAASLASRVARLFARDLEAALGPFDLAPAQLMVLRELWKAEELTQRDLAARLDVEQATMAKTLARMVRDGLVTREMHLSDGRARVIRPTDRARELRKPAKAAARAITEQAIGHLSKKERDRLVEMLEGIIAGFEARREGQTLRRGARGQGSTLAT
jgi:DNA-binding MarR family transcriptional regulator